MPLSSNSLLEKPEFRQEFRLGLVVYGGVSLAIYMNGVCREFYNAVRGRGIYKLIKALTDSDIIVDVISGTSAGGINGVLLSYALTNSDKSNIVDFQNFAEIWRESGDINRLLRQPNPKEEINSVLDGEGYYQDRLAEAFRKAWNKKISSPNKDEGFKDEWFSDSSELDLFVTGTDTLGKVYKAFDNTGCLIEVKDHRTVFLLKYRRGRKHPFQSPEESSVSPDALAKLCRITSCFPVAFPVITVQLENSKLEETSKEFSKERLEDILNNPKHPDYEKYFDYAIDKRLARWGQLQNRELPKEPPPGGYKLHFVDGGVLDNRPFSYTIREIYYRTAYRPVERKLFYIDPSPDQFLGSPKFNRMAKPNIWETISDSVVSLPRYESISNDLQEIKDRNERVLRYKFLRATAERVGEEKLERLQSGQQPSPDEIRRQQIYLRCRLVGMRDRILPLVLRIDQASVSHPNSNNQNDRRNQDKQALLESAAQLITKYITDKEQQKKREEFLHTLGVEIRNLDVNYALRKHFFLLEKICQFMGDPQYQDEAKYPNSHKELKQLAENLSRQVELLEVIQVALEGMLQSEDVSRTFYALLDQAQKRVLQSKVGSRSGSTVQIAEIRKDTRQYIYDYLLRLHRFLLDADGLTDFDPKRDRLPQENDLYAIDKPDDDKAKPVEIPADFFKDLPVPISSAQISGVLLLLDKKAKQLDSAKLGLTTASGEDNQLDLEKSDSIWKEDKYKFVEGYENNSTAYWSILHKVEQASEELIKLCNVTSVAELLLKSFQGFRYVDEEVYSYEYLSDIQAKEQIEIVRISPDVAQFGYGKGKGLAEKLAGDQLGAFGGFFKKSWRSNDILWGRMDGLNRSAEALLTSSALKNFSSFLSRQIDDMQAENKDLDTLVSEALPKATRSDKDSIIQDLAKLTKPTQIFKYLSALVDEALPEATEFERSSIIQDLAKLAVPNQTLEGEALTGFLNRIVTVGHRAILKTDLGNVLEDAIAKQLDWSQQLIGSKNSLPKYEPVAGYFDRVVTPFAVKELAASSIKTLLADPLQAEDYFRNVYHVGSETVDKDIPPVILEDLAARTALVLRDIVNSPPTGNRARQTITFQVVNRLLQAFYVWVQAKRTGTSLLPQAFKAWGPLLLLGTAIASVAFLVSKLPVWLLVLLITLVVLRFFNKVFNQGRSFAWMPWLVAIALVVLIITGLSFLPDSTSTIRTPFGEIRILIQNLSR